MDPCLGRPGATVALDIVCMVGIAALECARLMAPYTLVEGPRPPAGWVKMLGLVGRLLGMLCPYAARVLQGERRQAVQCTSTCRMLPYLVHVLHQRTGAVSDDAGHKKRPQKIIPAAALQDAR